MGLSLGCVKHMANGSLLSNAPLRSPSTLALKKGLCLFLAMPVSLDLKSSAKQASLERPSTGTAMAWHSAGTRSEFGAKLSIQKGLIAEAFT